MSDHFTSLPGLFEAVWRRLEGAVHDGKGSGRYLTLATRGLIDGAEARLVVLRQTNKAEGSVTIHTHALSHKVAELAADPAATLMMWDPGAALQARLRVFAEASPGSDGDWARVPETGRRLNYGTLPPALPIEGPGAIDHSAPDLAAFTRIKARIDMIDVLHLEPDTAQRARFSRELDFQGRWIAP